jgi:hypothetical protein
MTASIVIGGRLDGEAVHRCPTEWPVKSQEVEQLVASELCLTKNRAQRSHRQIAISVDGDDDEA